MLAINRTISRSQSWPESRKLLLTSLHRRRISSTSPVSRDSQYHRSDFQSQGAGFSASYDPEQPTKGPLSQASKHGIVRLTPSSLKEHLDKFIVGQDKAKKVTSVAIFNHYQRIREIRRREAEVQATREKETRWELRERERHSHPVENEYPGHIESVDLNTSPIYHPEDEHELGTKPLSDSLPTHAVIEKSNLMLLGPSGVGKSYILQCLASVLEVPFATVDCSSLTQAGYIGTDIESSIERLLLASNHNIQKCETGIIFFDELDKLAKPPVMTHGRDVSGEGVQQGLLKMIEGTTVTVNAKSDKNSKSESRGDRLERGGTAGSPSGKSEQYTIDTRNILFVFAGAFVGLDKIVSHRLQSGSSIGFGAQLRASPSTPPQGSLSPKSASLSRTRIKPIDPLKNVLSADLQTYGLIPELLGRIPILCTLLPLDLAQLVSILVEPQNSLVKQYKTLFNTFNIQLKFTTGSLHAIAERAHGDGGATSSSSFPEKGVSGGGLGARGLRSIMEGVLGEIMFWGPGSAIRFCLVDERFVREQRERDGDETGESAKMPRCWSRGQSRTFEEAFEKEENAWKDSQAVAAQEEPRVTFEAFRTVGSSGM